jgi:hypothetical protein
MFSTIFHTRPDTHVDRYVVALRYRKRTSRDWLYYEIAPQVLLSPVSTIGKNDVHAPIIVNITQAQTNKL